MSVHEENKKYQCMICDKKFKLKCTLEKHITLIHEPKKFTQSSNCDVMIVSYRFKQHIIQERKRKGKRHTNAPFIHENSKNSKPEFKSDVCMVIFTQIKSSTGHIREVHEGQKPYLFGICKKQFSGNNVLKTHISTVHEKNKQFQCLICDTSFS